MPQVTPQFFDHIAVVISSESQERVWRIWSVQTPDSTCAIKDLLTEDVSDHLNGCYKTTDTYTNVEEEWEL